MKFKLSIITINFNDKIGLRKTISSVVNQSFKDFEYIVIDGNSNDGSFDVIKEFKHDIQYWISENDQGVYNAMNKGISVARGDFLLFLNSGDSLIDEAILSKVVQELNDNISIYYGNVLYSNNGKPVLLSTPPKELTFSYFLNFSLPHPASFIKKDLFSKYFYYNEHFKIVSDWEFFIYCICKMNETYQHLDFVISDFDNGGISSSYLNKSLIIKEKKEILLKHFPLFISDIKIIHDFKSSKNQKIKIIKTNKIKWKLLKIVIDMLTIFDKKTPSEHSKYYNKI